LYCANCGKTFKKYERTTSTVMPGWYKPVPTCYDDRLCYARSKVLPAVIKQVVREPVLVFIHPRKRFRNKARGLAKYHRRYEFRGRLAS